MRSPDLRSAASLILPDRRPPVACCYRRVFAVGGAVGVPGGGTRWRPSAALNPCNARSADVGGGELPPLAAEALSWQAFSLHEVAGGQLGKGVMRPGREGQPCAGNACPIRHRQRPARCALLIVFAANPQPHLLQTSFRNGSCAAARARPWRLPSATRAKRLITPALVVGARQSWLAGSSVHDLRHPVWLIEQAKSPGGGR